MSDQKPGEVQRKSPPLNTGLWVFTVAIILALIILFVVFPDQSLVALNATLDFCSGPMGWLYLWTCFGSLILMFYFGFGRLGKIKFGGPDAKPEFSFIRWVAMVFFGSCGTSAYYWATIEWAYYYKGGPGNMPFDVVPGTWQAAEWASTYSMFHQGFIGWATYVPFALCLGYMYYNRKVRRLTVSEGCRPILGKLVDGPVGKFIDFLVIFGMIGGLSTSLGFAAPFVTNAICYAVGMEYTFNKAIIYQLFISIAQTIVLWLGLNKGLSRLTGLVNKVMVGFLGFVLLAGPTAFIINQFSSSFGNMITNFTKMAFWTDAVGGNMFPQYWTVFFFAWWVTFAPVMGIYIAKISKGRTMGQTALSMVTGGVIGVWLEYVILGNFSMYLDVNGILPVSDMLLNSDGSAGAGAGIVIQVLSHLPAGFFAIIVLIVLCFINSAVSTASTVYSFSVSTTKDLKVGEEPAAWNRIFWVWLCIAIAISLQFIGGINVLKTASTATILPLLFVMFIITASLFKMLKEDGMFDKTEKDFIYAPLVKDGGTDDELATPEGSAN